MNKKRKKLKNTTNESLGAVHTHTHTHTGYLLNKIGIDKRNLYIVKNERKIGVCEINLDVVNEEGRISQKDYWKNAGITLIALVITIIVLLILAGVSIATLTGNNGVIKQSQNAKIMTELSSVDESIDLYKTGKEIGNTGREEINDTVLVTDNIAKSVEVEDTSRLVGVIQDFVALKINSSLGNKGKDVNTDTISNIYDLDDVYVKDFTDGTLYYIKDRVLYSNKGNDEITKETKREGKLYMDLSSKCDSSLSYSTITATVSVGGLEKQKPYEEFAREKLEGVDEEGKNQIFLDYINLTFSGESDAEGYLPFKTVQDFFKWEYEKGYINKEYTSLEEFSEEYYGTSNVDELLIGGHFVYPQEYYEKYEQKYENYVVEVTKPDESTSKVYLSSNDSVQFSVAQNGAYKFKAELNGQIVEKSIEINEIKKDEIKIAESGENEYKIQTIEDLVALSVNTNRGFNYEGKTFKIEKDLDFNDEKCYKNPNDTKTFGDYNNDGKVEGIKQELTAGFDPIGCKYMTEINIKYDFKGILEGNNHTIKNLYINNPDTNYVGLIGINYGEIRNLTVAGRIAVERDDSNYKKVGSTVGYNYGNVINVENQVEFNIDNGYGYFGGVVGHNDGGIIEKCRNVKDINVSNIMWLGGVVGVHEKEAEVKDCYNTGNININKGGVIGGIVGYADTITATINRCYNTGNIKATDEVNYIGGIRGDATASGIIVNSYNLGNLNVEKTISSGGIIGYQKYGVVGNCYNRGNVTINGDSSKLIVGGLAGDQTVGCRIISCYNTGNVDVTATTPNAPGIGGISGIDYWALLKNVVNFGTITANVSNQSCVGSVSGSAYNSGYNVLENVKYLENTWTKGIGNKQDTDGVIESCTLDYVDDMLDLLNEDHPVIGDYTMPESVKFNKWKIVSGVNDGFPIFEWQGGSNE